jgi:hypothetical protein
MPHVVPADYLHHRGGDEAPQGAPKDLARMGINHSVVLDELGTAHPSPAVPAVTTLSRLSGTRQGAASLVTCSSRTVRGETRQRFVYAIPTTCSPERAARACSAWLPRRLVNAIPHKSIQ